MHQYVHGYSERETERLCDQSRIMEERLHSDTAYSAGSRVLEAGCGVGAQTVILARRSPQADITAVDISLDSLKKASVLINREGIANVSFQQSDILNLPFGEESFDHIFVCFVLEHFVRPLEVLAELNRVLREGGTVTVIEGDHGSCFWYPETTESRQVWQCLIEAQAHLGHNSLIGRQLYPLLSQAGFNIRYVLPRWIYVDAGNLGTMSDGINKIMVPMLESAREQALKLGLIDEAGWRKGISDLGRFAEPPGGTFFYTWFKGVGVKPGPAC